MTVLPRRVGTFFISRVETSLNDSAEERISSISSFSSSSMPRRSFLLSLIFRPSVFLFGSNGHYLVNSVHLEKMHLDFFLKRGRNVFPHVIRPYGQFPVPPVYKNRELYAVRTSEVHEGVHGGPYGAPGEENVVNHDDDPAVNRYRYVGFLERLRLFHAYVVAVESGVNGTVRRLAFFYRVYDRGEARGDVITARRNPQQNKTFRALVFFEYLVRDSRKSPVYRLFVQYEFFLHATPAKKKLHTLLRARSSIEFDCENSPCHYLSLS